MTSNDLLDYTCKYHEVRGWRARRVALSRSEWITLRLEDRIHRVPCDPCEQFLFDGALVTLVRSTAVAIQIREWDLQP